MSMTASGDMAMSGRCDGCDNQKAMTSAACSAYCGFVGMPFVGTTFGPAINRRALLIGDAALAVSPSIAPHCPCCYRGTQGRRDHRGAGSAADRRQDPPAYGRLVLRKPHLGL
jgi:hypothetical protein